MATTPTPPPRNVRAPPPMPAPRRTTVTSSTGFRPHELLNNPIFLRAQNKNDKLDAAKSDVDASSIVSSPISPVPIHYTQSPSSSSSSLLSSKSPDEEKGKRRAERMKNRLIETMRRQKEIQETNSSRPLPMPPQRSPSMSIIPAVALQSAPRPNSAPSSTAAVSDDSSSPAQPVKPLNLKAGSSSPTSGSPASSPRALPSPPAARARPTPPPRTRTPSSPLVPALTSPESPRKEDNGSVVPAQSTPTSTSPATSSPSVPRRSPFMTNLPRAPPSPGINGSPNSSPRPSTTATTVVPPPRQPSSPSLSSLSQSPPQTQGSTKSQASLPTPSSTHPSPPGAKPRPLSSQALSSLPPLDVDNHPSPSESKPAQPAVVAPTEEPTPPPRPLPTLRPSSAIIDHITDVLDDIMSDVAPSVPDVRVSETEDSSEGADTDSSGSHRDSVNFGAFGLLMGLGSNRPPASDEESASTKDEEDDIDTDEEGDGEAKSDEEGDGASDDEESADASGDSAPLRTERMRLQEVGMTIGSKRPKSPPNQWTKVQPVDVPAKDVANNNGGNKTPSPQHDNASLVGLNSSTGSHDEPEPVAVAEPQHNHVAEHSGHEQEHTHDHDHDNEPEHEPEDGEDAASSPDTTDRNKKIYTKTKKLEHFFGATPEAKYRKSLAQPILASPTSPPVKKKSAAHYMQQGLAPAAGDGSVVSNPETDPDPDGYVGIGDFEPSSPEPEAPRSESTSPLSQYVQSPMRLLHSISKSKITKLFVNEKDKSLSSSSSSKSAPTSPSPSTKQPHPPASPKPPAAAVPVLEEDLGGELKQEEGIVFLQFEKGSLPIIKGATIDKLIERLTFHSYSDPNYMQEFLLTYRSFTTPQKLLDSLKERWDVKFPVHGEAGKELSNDKFQKNKQVIRLRVYNVIKQWIDRHWVDYQEDPALVEPLVMFIELNVAKSMATPAKQLRRLIKRQIEGSEGNRKLMFSKQPPKPLLAISISDKFTERPINQFCVVDIHPKELARQITLLEYNLYKVIKPWECLMWNTKEKDKKSPNILNMIDRFNSVSRWVASEIVRVRNVKQRALVMGRFIEIAEELIGLHNYNGAMEIISGLNSAAIHRLKNTWISLTKKQQEHFQQFKVLMSGDNNWRNLRSTLHQIGPPCIPYLGLYLTDLTFINDGNPTFLPNGMVNFDKCRRLAAVVQEIQQYQQTPYCLELVDYIQAFITSVPVGLGDEDVYKRSLEIEPRVSLEHSKKARTGTVSLRSSMDRLKMERKKTPERIERPEPSPLASSAPGSLSSSPSS
eukprot:TRINITY_DN928_c0_g1_i4.p1 TRINITY_DN928_c0_g1~~TRINITY_DN928_c0_g1_i4.p1  ORF type:complete len:1284 (+),score=384.18 TRINITY_DN928_c0_g1_i4:97-3948(+)